MAKTRIPPEMQTQLRKHRKAWMLRATALVNQIADWSIAEGWTVERNEKMITEPPFGTYQVPEILVRLDQGELMITPVAAGGDGRVDLEAIPTLSRVRLVAVKGKWKLFADANVPLYLDWNQANFTQLAQDLLR